MVAWVLPLRATAPVAAAGAEPTNRAWRGAAAAALSATDARDGRRADKPALEGMRGTDAPAPTGAARRWIRSWLGGQPVIPVSGWVLMSHMSCIPVGMITEFV